MSDRRRLLPCSGDYFNPQTNVDTVDYAKPVWKPNLFKLQQEAPKSYAVFVPERLHDCPPFYGNEYPGAISHKTAEVLLQNDANYLIRLSPTSEGFFTLSFKICGQVRHYRLFYDGKHYVYKRKCFDTVEDLVTDGTITLYLEMKAGSYIQLMYNNCSYEKSPYVTLNHVKRKPFKNSTKSTETNLPDIVVNYAKMNSFKPHIFKGFYWCDFCGNFLWRFIAQGVTASDTFHTIGPPKNSHSIPFHSTGYGCIF